MLVNGLITFILLIAEISTSLYMTAKKEKETINLSHRGQIAPNPHRQCLNGWPVKRHVSVIFHFDLVYALRMCVNALQGRKTVSSGLIGAGELNLKQNQYYLMNLGFACREKLTMEIFPTFHHLSFLFPSFLH